MLKPGDNLYLEWANENGIIEKYKTIVASHEEHIYIEIPINEETNKYGFFILGTVFQVYYYAEGKVYNFESELIGRVRENVPLLILSTPNDAQMTVVQRREHVRVEANLDVALHSPTQQFNPFTSTLNDLSGGGCSVFLPKVHSLKSEMMIDLWIVLIMQSGRYQYVKIPGRVVRIFEKEGRNIASFQFKDINLGDRMHIIRYCFQRDLYLKKLVKVSR